MEGKAKNGSLCGGLMIVGVADADENFSDTYKNYKKSLENSYIEIKGGIKFKWLAELKWEFLGIIFGICAILISIYIEQGFIPAIIAMLGFITTTIAEHKEKNKVISNLLHDVYLEYKNLSTNLFNIETISKNDQEKREGYESIRLRLIAFPQEYLTKKDVMAPQLTVDEKNQGQEQELE